jgi:HIP---CoA ligase
MLGSDTLPALLRSAADRFGGRLAYVGDGREIQYAELCDTVRATAAGYRARGLAPGGRVVVWAPNSVDWVVAALSVSYAGGVLVPVNSRYTGHEVAAIVPRTDADRRSADGGTGVGRGDHRSRRTTHGHG